MEREPRGGNGVDSSKPPSLLTIFRKDPSAFMIAAVMLTINMAITWAARQPEPPKNI